MDFQKQLNLRNKNIVINPPKKVLGNQTLASQSNKKLTSKEAVQNKAIEKDVSKEKDRLEDIAKKVPETKRDYAPIEKFSFLSTWKMKFKNKTFSSFQ